MFSSFSNLVIANRMKKLLKKNRIEILQFDPGYLDLKSPIWLKHATKWRNLAKELQQDKRVTAVTYNQEEGTMLIIFDESLMEDFATIEKMLKRIEEVAK